MLPKPLLLMWWLKMLKAVLNTLISVAICTTSGALTEPALGQGEPRTFLVLGVIASAEAAKGVVLFKAMPTGETFAAKIGQDVDHRLVVERIERDYVYVRLDGKSERVRVGEQIDPADPGSQGERQDSSLAQISTGIERHGGVVKITAALRDSMTKDQLSKVLMQVAAIPYYIDGQLAGFRLWEIEAGSIYQKAGFIDGDIITAINGQSLTDVAMTIRLLQSLRKEPKVEVTLTRQGIEQRIDLLVQD